MNTISEAILPAAYYWSPEILEREYECLFPRTWQYVGSRHGLATPGAYFTRRVGRTPVVIVLDETHVIRAFQNVCAHRCHEVACGAGHARAFTCGYHGWTYGLDGRLQHAPHVTRAPDLALTPAPVATLGPLIFVATTASPPPFAEIAADLSRHIAAGGVDLGALEFAAHDEWRFAANWKIGIENFLECYHCAIAHPGLSSVVDVRPGTYRLTAMTFTSSQLAPPNVRSAAATAGPIREAQFHYLWPNCTITINPGVPNLFINTWLPNGPEDTTGFGDTFFASDVPAAEREAMLAFNAQVSREDDLLVESVQRGLRASAAAPRLLDGDERLIAHFQQLVAAALGAPHAQERSATTPSCAVT
ncbi:MAG TPA: aromatic ring-hydroxylating dioxygenase subunit alpha [Thermoanaerobaculia bacterium]|nr:aromatic ring-hydroxylating dioxygenase subunit alpha [Thermoanaerobaculia bacterium]